MHTVVWLQSWLDVNISDWCSCPPKGDWCRRSHLRRHVNDTVACKNQAQAAGDELDRGWVWEKQNKWLNKSEDAAELGRKAEAEAGFWKLVTGGNLEQGQG